MFFQLKSILLLKCPRCRKGNLLTAHPYKISNFNKVNERCSSCDLRFKIEPSFFYGSMYVSYGIGVGISMAVYLLMVLLGKTGDLIINFIVISSTLVILMPYINALSKVIWANFFFTYDPSKQKSNTL